MIKKSYVKKWTAWNKQKFFKQQGFKNVTYIVIINGVTKHKFSIWTKPESILIKKCTKNQYLQWNNTNELIKNTISITNYPLCDRKSSHVSLLCSCLIWHIQSYTTVFKIFSCKIIAQNTGLSMFYELNINVKYQYNGKTIYFLILTLQI